MDDFLEDGAYAPFEPWTQADQMRLRRLDAGLAAAREQVEGGVLSPEEGLAFQGMLAPQRARLLQRQRAARDAALRDQEGLLMRQAALGESVESHHDSLRADAFPATVARYHDPYTGRVAHFFQGSRGSWEQVKWDAAEAPQEGPAPPGPAPDGSVGSEQVEPLPPFVGQTMAPGGESPQVQGALESALAPWKRAVLGLTGRVAGAAAGARAAGGVLAGPAEGAAGVARAGASAAGRLAGEVVAAGGAAAGGGYGGGPPAEAPRAEAPQEAPEEAPPRPAEGEAEAPFPDDDLAIRAAMDGMSPGDREQLDRAVFGNRAYALRARGYSPAQIEENLAAFDASKKAEAASVREEAQRLGVDPLQLARAKFLQRDQEASGAYGRAAGRIEAEQKRKLEARYTLSEGEMAAIEQDADRVFGRTPPPGTTVGLRAGSRQELIAMQSRLAQHERQKAAWIARARQAIVQGRVTQDRQAAVHAQDRQAQADENRRKEQERSLEHQRQEESRAREREDARRLHAVELAAKTLGPGATQQEYEKFVQKILGAHETARGAGQGRPAAGTQGLLIQRARSGDAQAQRLLDQRGIRWR